MLRQQDYCIPLSNNTIRSFTPMDQMNTYHHGSKYKIRCDYRLGLSDSKLFNVQKTVRQIDNTIKIMRYDNRVTLMNIFLIKRLLVPCTYLVFIMSQSSPESLCRAVFASVLYLCKVKNSSSNKHISVKCSDYCSWKILVVTW